MYLESQWWGDLDVVVFDYCCKLHLGFIKLGPWQMVQRAYHKPALIADVTAEWECQCSVIVEDHDKMINARHGEKCFHQWPAKEK